MRNVAKVEPDEKRASTEVLDDFPFSGYLQRASDRAAGASTARYTSIEWSLGIIGVLLGASAATLSQNAAAALASSSLALVLVVPLFTVGLQSANDGRRFSVVLSHLDLRQADRLAVGSPGPSLGPKFDQHLKAIISEIDYDGKRVESRVSLILNTLLKGFLYLFFGAFAMELLALHQLGYPAEAVALGLGIPLAVVTGQSLYAYRQLSTEISRTLAKQEILFQSVCPACQSQDQRCKLTKRLQQADSIPPKYWVRKVWRSLWF